MKPDEFNPGCIVEYEGKYRQVISHNRETVVIVVDDNYLEENEPDKLKIVEQPIEIIRMFQ